MNDRVGIGWRPELAASVLANAERIDVVEVLAEEWTAAPAAQQRALVTLGAQLPVLLHGVSLGLASAAPVDERRLSTLARLVERIRPERWSEHLAFVRGGGVEIGHLAAPPRSRKTIDGTVRNVERAAAVVGAAPLLENVATLIDPPASEMDEGAWLRAILEATPIDLLLDLHNLHANATNFGFSAAETILALPPDRISMVHVAGGRFVGRLLDDHLHDVPPQVYELVALVAEHASGPLTIVLERDGNYPPFAELLEELTKIRSALERGRTRRGFPRGYRH